MMTCLLRGFPNSPVPALLALLVAAATPAQATLVDLERRFRELPPAARRLTGPLFWLHGDESPAQLEALIDKVADGGNGTLTLESRPHSDWLGPGWFRDLDVCIAAAKRRDLEVWIFDERWWPSQALGGRVPPRYAAKQLVATTVDVLGPSCFTASGHSGDRYIATIAGRLVAGDALDGDSLVDLASSVRDGRLTWQAPAGRWRVVRFGYELAPGLGQGGGRQLSVDGMSRDCVQWWLDTAYEPHFERFGEDFGETIVGFFYDEPETRGDWGTEIDAVLAERGVDWKQAYAAYTLRLAGDLHAAARFQYLDARAETWGRTMYGMTTQWCEARGVRSIGHFMEHGSLYRHPDYCAGDLMRLLKYSSMGGIDAVFRQFAWGRRDVGNSPCWQTPKLASSVSHAYGKEDDLAMVEIFGARGQDLSYPEMKWWTDAMQLAGVNFLIPHSFNPRAPFDTDCPPYFYDGGHEPRWPLYRVFADYTSRLAVMLTGGRHVAPVALVTPGLSHLVGRAAPVETVSEHLQDALYDCDWLPYEVLEQDVRIVGPRLQLRDEAYQVLFLPAVEVIPHATLALAQRFFAAGGVVVAHGFLPTKSATPGRTAGDIAALCEAVWGDAEPGLTACRSSRAGGRSYLLPQDPDPEQLRRVLADDAGIRPTLEVLEGSTEGWLHVLHRVRAGRDVFFVANQDHRGEARRLRLRVRAAGEPECWDAMRNELTTMACARDGEHAELDLTLEPNDSVLLVFAAERRALPTRTAGPAERTFAVVRDPTPRAPSPPLPEAGELARALQSCAWVWYPEGDPAKDAPAAERCFRRAVELPAERELRRATFTLTADNQAVLYVNGAEAGRSDDSADGWRNPVQLEVTEHLRAGRNQIAVVAANHDVGPRANPAGLIGRLTVEFADGRPLTLAIDSSWRAGRRRVDGWTSATFDDRAWPPARELCRHGAGPWGRVGAARLTLGPVPADPFEGHCLLPSGLDLADVRVHLELEDLAPEAAARVTVNGRYAGGFLGRPLRLDVTRWLRQGRNAIRIEPFAPARARLVLRPRD